MMTTLELAMKKLEENPAAAEDDGSGYDENSQRFVVSHIRSFETDKSSVYYPPSSRGRQLCGQ